MKTIPELDGVRALAILPVLAIHAYGRVEGGYLGVDLFFVLSGFLITSLLLEEATMTGTTDLARFYGRRALRILPPIILGALLACALWPAARVHDAMIAIPAALLFCANLVDREHMLLLGHTWSLSVEEHFYALWPVLLLALLPRVSRSRIAVLLVAVFVASAGLRAALFLNGSNPHVLYQFTLTHLDAICAGCLLAVLSGGAMQYSPRALGDAVLTASFLAILACVLAAPLYETAVMMLIGLAAFAGVCAALLWGIFHADDGHLVRRLLACNLARYIGRRSYGIYVYHLPVFMALEPYRAPQDLDSFVLMTSLKLAVTVVIAELSFRYVETPVLHLKNLWLHPKNSTR